MGDKENEVDNRCSIADIVNRMFFIYHLLGASRFQAIGGILNITIRFRMIDFQNKYKSYFCLRMVRVIN